MANKLILLFVLIGSAAIWVGSMSVNKTPEIIIRTDANGRGYIHYINEGYPIPEVRAFDGKDSAKVMYNDINGCEFKGKPNTNLKITFIK